MNKIIFVLIFLLFFMIGCSTNENSSECIFPGGQGTAADPYQISSAEDLELLATKIEKDEKGFISAYYILTQDIDMEGRPWIPIGYYNNLANNRAFTGQFDGKGYVIKNLSFRDEQDKWSSCAYGLFAYIDNQDNEIANIQNLTLNNVKISAQSKNTSISYLGTLAGKNDGRIVNCHVTGSLRGEGADLRVGGLVGENTGHLESCTVQGKVIGICQEDGAVYSGGLVGINTGRVINCNSNIWVTGEYINNNKISELKNIGGLIGKNEINSVIENSYAIGKVTGIGEQSMVGGLTGYNAGKIKFSHTDTVLTIDGKTEEIGAIGGLTVFNTKDGEINNCYIKGSIEAKGISSIIGTFVSYNDGIITNCYTCSTVSFNRTPDLLGCVSVNSVYDIENCYYDQSINPEMKAVAVGNADGIIGKSSAEMQDVKFMNLLNKNSQSENDAWIKMDSNAYPTLYTRL